MYQKIAPILLIEYVDAALLWYKDMFGAKLQQSLPKKPPFEWVSLLIGVIEIMFYRKKSAQIWYSDRTSKKMGADRILNIKDTDPEKSIMEITNGEGVDLVLEISGAQSAIDVGLEILRKGSRFIAFGVPRR